MSKKTGGHGSRGEGWLRMREAGEACLPQALAQRSHSGDAYVRGDRWVQMRVRVKSRKGGWVEWPDWGTGDRMGPR